MKANTITLPNTTSKPLNIALWIAQVLLAGMFIMSGFMKAAQPIAQLSQMLPWTAEVPVALVRFIGISEVLGGFGLLLPSLLRIKPQLTILASLGLVVVMLLAAGFHLMQGQANLIGMNIILALVAGFIVWGRTKKAPITARA